MTRRKVHHREPYAWLEKLVGDTAVFLVKSRTGGSVYRVTVSPPGIGSDEPSVHCNCVAGRFSYDGPARCFHGKRALASWIARRDPNAKKGRAPVTS